MYFIGVSRKRNEIHVCSSRKNDLIVNSVPFKMMFMVHGCGHKFKMCPLYMPKLLNVFRSFCYLYLQLTISTGLPLSSVASNAYIYKAKIQKPKALI